MDPLQIEVEEPAPAMGVPPVLRAARFEPRGTLTPRGPIGFTAITRRRNSYVLPADDTKPHRDLAQYEVGQTMRADLYNSCYRLAGHANRKATLFKIVNVLGAIYVLVCSFVVGVLTLDSGKDHGVVYAAGVLSLSVGLVKAGLMTFSLDVRASRLKECGFRLNKVCAELAALESYEGEGRKLVRKVLRYHGLVDEIEMRMYESNVVARDLAKATGIESGSSSGTSQESIP